MHTLDDIINADFQEANSFLYKIMKDCDIESEEECVNMLESGARKGVPDFQYFLGFCHYSGFGCEKDTRKAIKCWMKAAKNDMDDAQFLLGCAYFYGDNIRKSYKKAVYWFEKASQNGHVDAQYYLSGCYKFGLGTKKSQCIGVRSRPKATMLMPSINLPNLIFMEKESNRVMTKR